MSARHRSPSATRRAAAFLVPALALCCLVAGTIQAPAARAGSGDVLGFWAASGGGTDRDAFFDVAAARDGSLYAVGTLDQSPGGGTMLLVKFDAARDVVWERTYRPSGAAGASASVVVTDGAGNVVVGGGSTDGMDSDIAVVKWDASGARLWTAIHDGGSEEDDWISDVSVAADGSVYACGSIDDGERAIVLKYAAAADPVNPLRGRELWRYPVQSTAPFPAATATVLGRDGAGNLYVAGDRASATAHRNVYTLKLSPSGVRRWLRNWDGASHDWDSASRLKVKGSSVYVAADTTTKRRAADLALIKYDTTGRRRWVRLWDGGRGEGDNVAGLACDARGRAYVAVNSYFAGNVQKGFLVKYSGDGRRLWQRGFQGVSGEGGSLLYDVAVTGTGTAWVGGYVTEPSVITRWLTVKYAADGKRLWVRRWDGPPADPLGGQAWSCRLVGSSSVVMVGEVRTSAAGPAACVLWRRR